MMTLGSLLAAFAWAAVPTPAPAGAPEPAALLERAMAPSEQAYYGKMLEVQWYGKRARAAEIQVFYRPGMLRREIHAHGSARAQLAVSDGETEWIVLPAQKKAFRGTPSKTQPKQMTPEAERALLLENYTLRIKGEDAVAGRRAWKVDLLPRTRGKPRQSLWIDQPTGLILRSRRYHADGALAGVSEFVHLRLPADVPEDLFNYEPPPDYRVEEHGLSPQFLALADLRDAVASGPPVPDALPGGFRFESAGTVSTRGRNVVHLRYTDGLLSVSLFQSPVAVRLRELSDEPGEGRLPGGRVLKWKSGGRQYVLIGDLSKGLMRRLAAEFKTLKKSDSTSDAGLKQGGLNQ